MLRDAEVTAPRCRLEREYGAALLLDPARVAVNFVSSIDGIVSFGLGGANSRAVSGGSPADRLVMAMLRAVAGVVVIGAGTLRATRRHQWTPEALAPERAADLRDLRAAAGLPPAPAPLLVVSGTGGLPADADAVARPAVPLAVLTLEGVESAAAAAVEHNPPSSRLDAGRIVAAARARAGEGPVLCEGGPTLFGSLLDGGVALDLFLTVAPQLAGRAATAPERRSLVEGVALPPFARGAVLRSIRQAGDHLLLRYAVTPGDQRPPGGGPLLDPVGDVPDVGHPLAQEQRRRHRGAVAGRAVHCHGRVPVEPRGQLRHRGRQRVHRPGQMPLPPFAF